jgi:hypothetical protein
MNCKSVILKVRVPLRGVPFSDQTLPDTSNPAPRTK